MELRCVCGSENLHIHRYRDDFATCLGCGHTGDIEGDFLVKEREFPAIWRDEEEVA